VEIIPPTEPQLTEVNSPPSDLKVFPEVLFFPQLCMLNPPSYSVWWFAGVQSATPFGHQCSRFDPPRCFMPSASVVPLSPKRVPKSFPFSPGPRSPFSINATAFPTPLVFCQNNFDKSSFFLREGRPLVLFFFFFRWVIFPFMTFLVLFE